MQTLPRAKNLRLKKKLNHSAWLVKPLNNNVVFKEFDKLKKKVKCKIKYSNRISVWHNVHIKINWWGTLLDYLLHDTSHFSIQSVEGFGLVNMQPYNFIILCNLPQSLTLYPVRWPVPGLFPLNNFTRLTMKEKNEREKEKQSQLTYYRQPEDRFKT